MNADGTGRSARRPPMVARQGLLIEPMAGFVQRSKKRLVEKSRVVTSRDSRITRAKTTAKRMSGDIESSCIEVKTQRRGRRLPEHLLAINREVSLQDFPRRLSSRGRDRAHQRHKIIAKRSKRSGDLGRRRAGLIFIEQSIVGGFFIADGLRFLPFEFDDFLQPRLEDVKLIGLAGFLPDLLSAGGNAG